VPTSRVSPVNLGNDDGKIPSMLRALNLTKNRRLPLAILQHLTGMLPDKGPPSERQLRTPAEPYPYPIQDPVDPPENPDVPVREPDPEDPGQI